MFSPREILCEKEVLSAEQIKVKSKSHFFSKMVILVFLKSCNLESIIEQENSYPRLISHSKSSKIPRDWN